MPSPDFLCIGSQKSGTTWLYDQLERHPQIWLPPIKELHYFDRPTDKRLLNNIFSTKLKGKFVRSSLKTLFEKGHVSWLIWFIFQRRCDSYYKGLFRPIKGQICGEVTPAYAMLNPDTIAHIAKFSPDLKLIYLLRNPIDRIWSQMNMFRRRSDTRGDISDEEVMAIKKDKLFGHTRYIAHIERWTEHFDGSKLFIGFFDQIKEEPSQLIQDVFSFLEIDASYSSPELQNGLVKPSNQGCHGVISSKLEYELTQQLLPEIEALHRRFENKYTQRWLNRATDVLNKGNASREYYRNSSLS